MTDLRAAADEGTDARVVLLGSRTVVVLEVDVTDGHVGLMTAVSSVVDRITKADEELTGYWLQIVWFFCP